MFKNNLFHLNCGTEKRFGTAVKLMVQFFSNNHYVPGFGDVVVYTSQPSKAKKLLRGKIDFAITVCVFGEVPKCKPDIVWIDDVTLSVYTTNKLKTKFAHLPCILSSDSKSRSTIIADTREQKPMWKNTECKRMKLEVGDYTTNLLHNSFHVERKSPGDLYGTLTQGHVRFRNELIVATAMEIKLVVFVETTRAKFLSLQFPGGKHRKMTGARVLQIVDTMEKRYKTEVVWCSSRADCKKKILLRFKQEEKKLLR